MWKMNSFACFALKIKSCKQGIHLLLAVWRQPSFSPLQLSSPSSSTPDLSHLATLAKLEEAFNYANVQIEGGCNLWVRHSRKADDVLKGAAVASGFWKATKRRRCRFFCREELKLMVDSIWEKLSEESDVYGAIIDVWRFLNEQIKECCKDLLNIQLYLPEKYDLRIWIEPFIQHLCICSRWDNLRLLMGKRNR